MKAKLIRFLAEILIIFIGITLSFLFDEYRESKKDTRVKKEIISALLTDIEIKRKELEGDMKSVQQAIDPIDTSLYLIKEGKQIPQDLIEKFIWSISYDYGSFSTTTPTYVSLSSSSIWQQLPDSIRRDVFELYNGGYSFVENSILKSYEYSVYLKNHFFTSHRFSFYNIPDSNLKLGSLSGNIPAELEKSLNDPEFRSAILNIRNERTKIIRFQKRAIEMQIRVIALLKNYLKEL